MSSSSSSSSSSTSNNNGLPEHVVKFEDPNLKNSLRNRYSPLVAQIDFSNQRSLFSTVPRNNNVFAKNNKAKIPRLKAPYRKRELDRFEDAYRCDGLVRNGVNKKWNFVMGAHTSVSLDVNKEFQSNEERAMMIQKVMSYEPYRKAMDCANQTLRKVNFRKIIHAACVQASIYGRSCVEKVRDPVNGKTIVHLNILNSKLLGDVEVDHDTWEFLGIHYRDLPKDDDLLEANDIIYFTRNDVHVSPGSLYYGLSDLETVIDGSETKRIIKQQDLKEIAKALWAGFGWIQFTNPNVTHKQIEEIVEKMKAGAWTATDQDVMIDVKEIAQNSPVLLEIINEMNLETARDLAIPSPLVGYENSQNYSNLVQTLVSWKESDLSSERRWLMDIIESQLLNEIFEYELEKLGIKFPTYNKDNNEDNNNNNSNGIDLEINNNNNNNNNSLATPPLLSTSTSSSSSSPHPPPTVSFTETGDLIIQKPNIIQNDDPSNPLQPNGLITTTTDIIPAAKLVIDIEDPNFDTFEKKVQNCLALYDKDLISARKVLEVSDMADEIGETELRLKEKQQKTDQMMGLKSNLFENQLKTTDSIQDKKLNILNKLEGELENLNNISFGDSNNNNNNNNKK